MGKDGQMENRKSKIAHDKSSALRLTEEAIGSLEAADVASGGTARAYESEALRLLSQAVRKLAEQMEMLVED